MDKDEIATEQMMKAMSISIKPKYFNEFIAFTRFIVFENLPDDKLLR